MRLGIDLVSIVGRRGGFSHKYFQLSTPGESGYNLKLRIIAILYEQLRTFSTVLFSFLCCVGQIYEMLSLSC